jgi:hypothetical protein
MPATGEEHEGDPPPALPDHDDDERDDDEAADGDQVREGHPEAPRKRDVYGLRWLTREPRRHSGAPQASPERIHGNGRELAALRFILRELRLWFPGSAARPRNDG